MPLGLKILATFNIIGLIYTVYIFPSLMTGTYLLGIPISSPVSIVVGIGLFILTAISVMSFFNRKRLFWKIATGYNFYALLNTLVLLIGVFTGQHLAQATPLEKNATAVVYSLLLILSFVVAFYYYKQKEYFNKK